MVMATLLTGLLNGREQVTAPSKERCAFRALPPRHECRGFTRKLMKELTDEEVLSAYVKERATQRRVRRRIERLTDTLHAATRRADKLIEQLKERNIQPDTQ